MPDIGDIIRILREEQGYTQSALANRCGVCRHSIQLIENTNRGNLSSVEAILAYLGYELEVVPINGRD